MRRLFEAAARVLRDRREMTVAVATAIVAVILIGGGQGDLAAIVALGAAGLMAGRAEKNRLAAAPRGAGQRGQRTPGLFEEERVPVLLVRSPPRTRN